MDRVERPRPWPRGIHHEPSSIDCPVRAKDSQRRWKHARHVVRWHNRQEPNRRLQRHTRVPSARQRLRRSGPSLDHTLSLCEQELSLCESGRRPGSLVKTLIRITLDSDTTGPIGDNSHGGRRRTAPGGRTARLGAPYALLNNILNPLGASLASRETCVSPLFLRGRRHQ